MFKVYLTKEQWERVCKADKEIAIEVAKQQPALAADLGFELKTTEEVVEKEAESPKPSRKSK